MKHRIGLLRLLFLQIGLFPAVALSIPLPQITISPFSEMYIGEAREFVYKDDKVLSELIWDMHPMLTFGLRTGISWQAGLQIAAEISAGLPMNTGSMEDSDWMNLFAGIDTAKTHFSRHDAALQYAYTASIDVCWNFDLPLRGPGADKKIRLTPLIGLRYLLWKWNAEDGYIQHTVKVAGVYPEWNADMPKVPIYGVPITYLQEYWMPMLGISLTVPTGRQFEIGTGIAGSFWVNCIGIDNHFLRDSNNTFLDSTVSLIAWDIMSGGFLIEPSFSFKWNAFPRVSFFTLAKWTIIDDLRGDTAEQSSTGGTETWYKESSGKGGGASFNAVNIRLGVETRLN